ncbi:MAG: hypothetical protein IKW49_07315 [Opitutales bacterium]|nr:hypothetical protein [Opitutales bacterium]
MKTSKFFLTTLFAAAAMTVSAHAAEYKITASGDQKLIDAASGDTVTIDFSSNDNSYFYAVSSSASYVVNADVVVVDATLHNGSSNKTYTFNGAISGTGAFYYQANKGSNTQTYVFNGDVSGYSGAMSIASNKVGTFTFNNNKTGTGTISATSAGSVLNLNGVTVNNSAINVTTINVRGKTSLAADTVWTGNVSVASGAEVSASGAKVFDFAAATLTNAGTLDLSDVSVSIKSAITNTGTVVVSEDTTFSLDHLTASNGVYTIISGGTLSGSLDYSNFSLAGEALSNRAVVSTENGVVTVSSAALDLIWAGSADSNLWTKAANVENWSTMEGASVAFSNLDSVTFASEGYSNVRVQETIIASSIAVGGDYTLELSGDANITTSELAITANKRLTLSGDGSFSAQKFSGTGTLCLDGVDLQLSAATTLSKLEIGSKGSEVNAAADLTITELSFQRGAVLSKTGVGTLLLSGDLALASGQRLEINAGLLHIGSGTPIATTGTGTIALKNGTGLYLDGKTSVHKLSQNIETQGDVTLTWKDAPQSSATAYQYELTGDIAVANGTLSIHSDTNNWAKEIAFKGSLSGAGTVHYYRGSSDSEYNSNGRLIIAGADNSGFTGTVFVEAKNNFSAGLDLLSSLKNATLKLSGNSGGQDAFVRVLGDVAVKRLEGNAGSQIGAGNILQGGTVGNYTLTVGEGDYAGKLENYGVARQYGSNSKQYVNSGSLSLRKVSDGALTLSGTVALKRITVDAGTLNLTSTNGVTLEEFAQSGGTTSVSKNLTASTSLTQSGGSLSIAGTLSTGALNLGGASASVTGNATVQSAILGADSTLFKGKLTVSDVLTVQKGTTTISGVLDATNIVVAGGKLSAPSLAQHPAISLSVSGGELVLSNAVSTEYTVDLSGGKITGLNLSAAKETSTVSLHAGTLDAANLSNGTIVLYAEFVDAAERDSAYLNNDVALTIDGSLTLSADKTVLDISNLIFESAGDKYALFNIGNGASGEAIVTALGTVAGLPGTFSVEGNYVVFTADSAMEIAMPWNTQAGNDYWSGTEFQGTAIGNLESRMVRFGRILPVGTNVENVNILAGAKAKSLLVSASDTDVYNLNAAETNASLTLDSLRVARGTLKVNTETKLGSLELAGGTLIASVKNALAMTTDAAIKVDGAVLSLQNASATNAKNITLNGAATLEFVNGALNALADKGVKITGTSENTRATLSWLSANTDDVAGKVSFTPGSYVNFNVTQGVASWGAGAAESNSGNVYYKTGAGVLFLEDPATLNGEFFVNEGTLRLGWADNSRVFLGNITVDGENSVLHLADENSFGTESGLGDVRLAVKNGGKVYLFSDLNTDVQTLNDVELVLGDNALVASDPNAERRNRQGLIIGTGTTVRAEGDAEISTVIQLAQDGGATFEVVAGATLTLSGALVDSLEEAEKGRGLNKTGAGTLVLSGAIPTEVANTFENYTGNTMISEGVLRFTGSAVPGSGKITVQSGAMLEAAGSGTLAFTSEIDGNGDVRVVSGTALFSSNLSGVNAMVDAGARFELAEEAAFNGSANISGEFGGNGTFKGAATFGEGAKLYAGADASFLFEATSVAGEHSFTKTGSGDVTVAADLANDFSVAVKEGTLMSDRAQTVDTVTLSGGNLGTTAGGAGRWTASKLYVGQGISSIQSNFTLSGPMGQNNLHLEGALYVGGALGNGEFGSLEVEGTLNLSGTTAGALSVGAFDADGVVAGGRVYADTLNVASTVKTITLGTMAAGDVLSELAFTDANFAGNIDIRGTSGKVTASGTVTFAGSGTSVIDGRLHSDNAVFDITGLSAMLKVGDKFSGSLTKTGEGKMDVALVQLNEVETLNVEDGQLIIESVRKPEGGVASTLKQVSLVDGAILSVRQGALEFANGGTLTLTDASRYVGNVLIGENASLNIADSEIVGTVELLGNASVAGATIKEISFGKVEVADDGAASYTQMTGKLTVSGGSPAIKAEDLAIVGGLTLDNISVDYSTLGAEFTIVNFEESLDLLNYDLEFSDNKAVLANTKVDGRDIYLTIENNGTNPGGALKIVAYGTLLWDGATTWNVNGDRGWILTNVGGNDDKQAFTNDKYVGFNFSGNHRITVAEDVNVGGVVFNGAGEFTLDFQGGLIKDKADGKAASVSVQAGTVVFNDKGLASTDGAFSGGLNIASGASVKTNSDKLIGSGTIALSGTLAFTGANKEYNLAKVTTDGNAAVLNVAGASSATIASLTGTTLTKAGAGALTLSGEATLGKLLVNGGDVTVGTAGEVGIGAIELASGAGKLVFEANSSLGSTTSLTLASSKRVEFVATASKLNNVSLESGAEVAFRTNGTFTVGGENVATFKNASGTATISGNLALQGVESDGDAVVSGATFEVADAATLKIDGSVSDVADAGAGNFLIKKSGKGALVITGDVDTKASLLLTSGSIVAEGSVNLSGDVEVGGNASFTADAGGWIGMKNKNLVVAEGATLNLKSSEGLSVLSNLTVAGALVAQGEVVFSGSENIFKSVDVASNSRLTLSSEVNSFKGEAMKLGANAELVVDDARLSESSGVLTVDAAGTSVNFENDGKIVFSSVYVTGEQTMDVTGDGEMVVLGEIETKLTVNIAADAGVTIDNAKTVQVGKFLGDGALKKTGRGELYILQKSADSFAGTFEAQEGSTYFYGNGSLGQAQMIADAEVVFARKAVIGNSGKDVVANALIGGTGTVAVIGSENSLTFANAIGSAFTGALEAREGGTLVYNRFAADTARNVKLADAGVLSVAALNDVAGETATALALGTLSVSGKGNEVALAEGRELKLASVALADTKGVATLTFSGSGSASVAGSISKNAGGKGELDLYTAEDFSGTLTLAGADNAHRNTYVNAGTLVIEHASAGGTGTLFLSNLEKSVVRFDVGEGNVVSTAVSGVGSLEGKSGTITNLDAFSGVLVAVDGGAFTLDKGASGVLAAKTLILSAEEDAKLVVTTDKTVAELDMGAAVFSGNGMVSLDLAATQELSVYTSNAITGTLEIAGGSVRVLEEGNLGTAAVAIRAGASLNVAADVLTNREIYGEGSIVKNTSGTSFVAGVINAKTSVSTGALSITATGENAQFEIRNGTLEFSQVYEDGRVISRKTGTQTFNADYVADGVARFSHSARNSNSVIDGSFAWKADAAGTLIFAGGGTGSEFLPEIENGNVVKTGAGKWHLDAFSSSGSIKVENGGGTLALGGYVGDAAQEIFIGRDGVLEIAEFGGTAAPVVKGKVSGSGMLAVSVTTSEVTFDVTGDSDWVLRVDADAAVKYGSGLSANNILLSSSNSTQKAGGTLNIDVAAGTVTELAGKTFSIRGTSKDFLDLRNAKLVKRGAGVLDLTASSVELNGLLLIEEGTLKAASFKSNPTTGVIEVQGNGTLEVGLAGQTGSLAALAGAGYVNVVAGTVLVENINGAQTPEEFNSDFSGSVCVDAGAKLVIKPYASLGNAGDIRVLGTLENSQMAESALNKLSGNGTLVIANTQSDVRTIYGNDNAFAGNIEIKSGRLVVNASSFESMTNAITLSADAASGLALRNDGASPLSLSALGEKNIGASGTFFLESADANGSFVLVNGASFGFGSLTHLTAGADLAFGKGATLTTGLYVAEGASLRLESNVSHSIGLRGAAANASREVEGDLTIAGKLFADIPAAGTTAIHANGTAVIEKTAVVEINGVLAEGNELALVSSDVKAIENGALFRSASGERLSARVADNATKILVGSATPIENLVPSGMGTLAETVFSNTDSDIYKAIYWSGNDAEQRAKLTNFSPVSFAGALELSTELTKFENDLLRQRLEQRRYDRAYSEAEGTIKGYANIIGGTSETSEGKNKTANYDLSHSGAVAGFDSLVTYDFLLGASFTYDFGKASVHNGGGKHETDTARVNFYGMAMLDEVSYFGFSAGFGVSGVDMKRTNALETLKSESSGTDISLSTTLGRMFVLSEAYGLHVSPYIGLDYTYSRIGGFREVGGESALEVDDLERNSLRGTIGATLNWLPTADWRFTLEAALRHEFLDSDTDVEAKFVRGAYAGMSATSTAYFGDENVISVGPRVEYRINSEWAVSAGYTLESDLDNTTTHSANVGIRCRF